jgi:hypothetical protein
MNEKEKFFFLLWQQINLCFTPAKEIKAFSEECFFALKQQNKFKMKR